MDLPPTDDPEDPPDPEVVECGMCHRRVPQKQTQQLSGRILCFGCLSGWYESDEDDS